MGKLPSLLTLGATLYSVPRDDMGLQLNMLHSHLMPRPRCSGLGTIHPLLETRTNLRDNPIFSKITLVAVSIE